MVKEALQDPRGIKRPRHGSGATTPITQLRLSTDSFPNITHVDGPRDGIMVRRFHTLKPSPCNLALDEDCNGKNDYLVELWEDGFMIDIGAACKSCATQSKACTRWTGIPLCHKLATGLIPPAPTSHNRHCCNFPGLPQGPIVRCTIKRLVEQNTGDAVVSR